MGRVDRSPVRARSMNLPGRSPPDPAEQFTQQDQANSAKDDQRPRFPHQSVDQMVQLRIGHTRICSGFRAKLPTSQCDGRTLLRAGICSRGPSQNTVEERKKVSQLRNHMTKFITLLIGFFLAFAAVAQAKRAEQENPKNKKSAPVQQRQVAPKQQQVAPRQQPKAPNPQVQAMPRQSKKPAPDPLRTTDSKPHKQERSRNAPADQRFIDVPPVSPNKPVTKPRGGGSLSDGRYQVTAPEGPKTLKKLERTVPAVQSDKFKLNKTVKTFQPRHRDFKARVNPSIASVRFNQDFRIRNAENWRGHHYEAFRTYRPQWHDRDWWRSNHSHIVLIGGGWYFWNSGYWYPAWGYDDSAAYYPYDGPIYVGSNPRPFDQVVADVQSVLQEQGYYRGEVDGLVGPLTQEALAAYQSAQGLEPTAAIDQPTLESLGIS